MKSFPWKPLLQRHPIFSAIHDERRLDALLEDDVSEERIYAKNVNIVRQGKKGNSLFVMGSGSAEVLLEVGGGETVHLSTIERDDVFGEMAFFEQGSRAATVRARELCTVLEIPGPAIQKILKDYPDIGIRLLLLMGERLRQTNERILALHLKTVDEKLDLFNKRLETDQRIAEAELKAAQTVFDQTKLRAAEVIDGAEKSRNRLTWFASIVGTFVTILITILGALGLKEVLNMRKLVEDVRKDAKEVEKIKGDAEGAMKEVQKLEGELIGVYRTRFIDALGRDSPADARNIYNQISGLNGLGGDGLGILLRLVEQDIVAKAKLQPKNAQGQKSNVKDYLLLFGKFENDAKSPRDRLDVCYLRSVYVYINDQVSVEDASGQLEKCLKGIANEVSSRKDPELAEWIDGQSGKRQADLRKLSYLAKITLEGP